MIQIEGIGEVQRRLKSAVERLEEFDWQQIGRHLDHQGNAVMERLLSPEQCRAIAGLYSNDDLFRSRVVMGRHGFGRGEYKYFSYPLPDLLNRLRTGIRSRSSKLRPSWAPFSPNCRHDQPWPRSGWPITLNGSGLFRYESGCVIAIRLATSWEVGLAPVNFRFARELLGIGYIGLWHTKRILVFASFVHELATNLFRRGVIHGYLDSGHLENKSG